MNLFLRQLISDMRIIKHLVFSVLVLSVTVDISAQVEDSTNYYVFKGVQNKTSNGSPALEMDYVGKNGSKITMDDLKGKIVFLDFWASYCSYCVSQIPEINKLQDKYPDIAVVRISVDDRESAWLNASEKHNMTGFNLWADGMTYPANNYTLDLFYFDANEANGLPASFELSNPIPGYVLIDQSGNIVTNWAPEPGTKELDDLIKMLLN
jgi:thiol-disulfide isomerase/thioredoxin